MKLSGRLALLSNIVSVACVVGIAATVAWAVWFFVQPPAPIAFGAASVAAPTSDSGKQDLSLYLNSNPFGASRRGENDPVRLDSLKETRLDLVLVGCFPRFHDPAKSVAMISSNRRSSKSYRVGDILEGFAKLVAIHGDSVELERNGKREVLRFKRGQNLLTATPAIHNETKSRRRGASNRSWIQGEGVRKRGGEGATLNLKKLEDQWRLTPKKHLREVSERLPDLIKRGGLSAVSKDSASGYKLNQASMSPALSNLGLREGDVLVSVNGKALGSQKSDQGVLDAAFTSESARLKVKRGDRSFVITVPMK